MFKITWSCGISKVRFERVGDGFHLCIYDPFWLKSAVHNDERIFSSVGMMIVPMRNRLNDDILEASKCLRSWFILKLGGEF